MISLTGYFRVIRARQVKVENKKETYIQKGLMHLNLRSCARTTRLKPLIIFVKLHLQHNSRLDLFVFSTKESFSLYNKIISLCYTLQFYRIKIIIINRSLS